MIRCLLNFDQNYLNVSGGDLTYYKSLFEHKPKEVIYVIKSKSWDAFSPLQEFKKTFLYRLRQVSFLPEIIQKIIRYEFFYMELNLLQDVDLVHSQYWPVIIRRGKKVPIVWSQAGLFKNWCDYRRIHQQIWWYTLNILAYLHKKYTSKVQKIVLWTETARRNEIRYTRIPPEKIVAIPPGISIPQKISEPTEDPLMILFIGVDYRRKGLSILIQAFEKLAKKYDFISLTIIGAEIPSSSLIHKKVHRNERIHYYKYIHPEILKEKFYRKAAIFVLPTYAETYGMVIPEAMSYQIPVISTRIPPITELIKDGHSGLLIPPGSLQSLIKSLEQLIVDRSLRHRLGSNARQQVIQTNSFNIVNKKLYDVYESVIHQ